MGATRCPWQSAGSLRIPDLRRSAGEVMLMRWKSPPWDYFLFELESFLLQT